MRLLSSLRADADDKIFTAFVEIHLRDCVFPVSGNFFAVLVVVIVVHRVIKLRVQFALKRLNETVAAALNRVDEIFTPSIESVYLILVIFPSFDALRAVSIKNGD